MGFNSFDPMKIAREMVQKSITLYVVGVEPSIGKPFFKYRTTLIEKTTSRFFTIIHPVGI